jgi:hypothetical protein
MFDTVWENIGRYAAATPDKGNAIAKYIIFSPNVGDADIRGFVGKCAEKGIKKIIISSELNSMYGLTKNWPYSRFGEKEIQAGHRLYSAARKEGIRAEFRLWPKDNFALAANIRELIKKK